MNDTVEKKEGGVTIITKSNGDIHYFLDNLPHRIGKPAILYADGGKEWWIHGYRHRDLLHAVELADGTRMWYNNGQLHWIKKPAV